MKTILLTIALSAILNIGYTQTGTFSLGSRNTISLFSDIAGEKTGKGIGGQFRLQLNNRLNTEWFADYITSSIGKADRNDYHIGWSLMYYPLNQPDFSAFLKPYILIGHCFDKSVVYEIENKNNRASRLSIATQAGAGTHFNLTSKLDCSLSCQYMIHFGKDIHIDQSPENLIIQKDTETHADGHLLFSISFNYKLFQLWKS